MNYIEYIYICLAAPILIAAIVLTGSKCRAMISLLVGMSTCLLSSYINSFMAAAYGVDNVMAAIEIAPVVEECMKLVPIIFYLLVFEPGKETAADEMLLVAIGFATFENVCYLTGHGASDILHLSVRGFGTGAMHVMCGSIVAIGILSMWDRLYLRMAGSFALVCVAITYHAIYNLLVSADGVTAMIGYVIPIFTIVPMMMLRNKMKREQKAKKPATGGV